MIGQKPFCSAFKAADYLRMFRNNVDIISIAARWKMCNSAVRF